MAPVLSLPVPLAPRTCIPTSAPLLVTMTGQPQSPLNVLAVYASLLLVILREEGWRTVHVELSALGGLWDGVPAATGTHSTHSEIVALRCVICGVARGSPSCSHWPMLAENRTTLWRAARERGSTCATRKSAPAPGSGVPASLQQ